MQLVGSAPVWASGPRKFLYSVARLSSWRATWAPGHSLSIDCVQRTFTRPCRGRAFAAGRVSNVFRCGCFRRQQACGLKVCSSFWHWSVGSIIFRAVLILAFPIGSLGGPQSKFHNRCHLLNSCGARLLCAPRLTIRRNGARYARPLATALSVVFDFRLRSGPPRLKKLGKCRSWWVAQLLQVRLAARRSQ